MFQIIFLIIFFVCSQCNAQSNFFIPESDSSSKKKSKTALKEDLGDELKDALYTSVALANDLGVMQSEISKLQENLLSNVEGLVANDRKFKRSGKAELAHACKVMSKIRNELKSQKNTIEKMLEIMNVGGCLKCERVMHEKGIRGGRRAVR